MTSPDPERADDGESDDGADGDPTEGTVERPYTCAVCGFAMVHETRPLRVEVQSVCHNCGAWTVQAADVDELVETARVIADDLAGETLTERQALAYLLREELGVDRQVTADAMDSTPSNVDNLQRRAAEKVEDAERVVDTLESLRPDEDEADEMQPDADEDEDREPGTGPRRI